MVIFIFLLFYLMTLYRKVITSPLWYGFETHDIVPSFKNLYLLIIKISIYAIIKERKIRHHTIKFQIKKSSAKYSYVI